MGPVIFKLVSYISIILGSIVSKIMVIDPKMMTTNPNMMMIDPKLMTTDPKLMTIDPKIVLLWEDYRTNGHISEKLSAFFLILYISYWGKNIHTFYQLGKKYAFPPPLSYLLSIIFFPNLIFGHIFALLPRAHYTPLSSV